MECLGKKRKGVEISSADEQTRLAMIWSHLSLGDYSRRKKKCKEIVPSKFANSSRSIVNGVATAPTCGTARLEFPCRGLKRKIGCIDAATRVGRKKKIDHDYELDKTLGQGKFGSVVLCRSKATGEEFACKILKKGEEIVHREVEIMQHLSGHPGVVTLKAVYEDSESFHLVMELCSGGRLLDQMAREGQYSERKAAGIIKELMLAVRYCHEMGVVHRDIKPENILMMASGQMKLADFGLAVRILDGVLLHALLIGVLPFQGDSLETVFEAIKKDKLEFTGDNWESVSQPARDLLSKMLMRNISTRFTANDVLRHPWISFYTEPTLKTTTPKPNKNHIRFSSRHLTSNHGPESKRFISQSCLSDVSSPTSNSSHSIEAVDGEDSGLIDVLAVAISRVRISEPKRSRICSSSRPLSQQECSSNLNTSNLCTAF